MSQGKEKLAWATMAKLEPSAAYANTENGNQQNVETIKVCLLELFGNKIL